MNFEIRITAKVGNRLHWCVRSGRHCTPIYFNFSRSDQYWDGLPKYIELPIIQIFLKFKPNAGNSRL